MVTVGNKILYCSQPRQNAAVVRLFRAVLCLHHWGMLMDDHSLMIEAENTSEMSDYCPILTQLAVQKDFIAAQIIY
jgi:hypothetical protein